jgi:hypothetical protein
LPLRLLYAAPDVNENDVEPELARLRLPVLPPVTV